MPKFTEQQRAANYMGALAHLLGGAPGRHEEFIDKVELILSGREADAIQLMQFTARCRQTGRPVLWVHVPAHNPAVPQIGMVVLVDGQTRVFENCMLWTSTFRGRARLVPDGFTFGAYRFDDDLRLRDVGRAPAKSFKAAEPGMVRAYRRLRELEVEQLDRGDAFKLPELAEAA